jgi:hypothetical protein
MFKYAETLVACTSALYFLFVLFAIFLDDQWRVWGTMLASSDCSHDAVGCDGLFAGARRHVVLR